MRILIIEDDEIVASTVELFLRSEGFRTHTETFGEEALEVAKLYEYDAILMDLNLPDMSGVDVLRKLRMSKVNTPVLVLSGQTDMDTKIKCLSAGADDYLVKPANNAELAARLRAVVRRAKGHAQSVIQIGDLAVNLDIKAAEIDGERVPLSSKEYQLLELLALRRGTTLTKETFLNHLYGEMDEPEAKIIDVFVCKLRKKLAAYTNGKNYIETVWGQGYLIRGADKMDVERVAA
ncbi:MAG TPA: response regulator transcription factor [Caulobacteraceae bacterium]